MTQKKIREQKKVLDAKLKELEDKKKPELAKLFNLQLFCKHPNVDPPAFPWPDSAVDAVFSALGVDCPDCGKHMAGSI